MKTLVIYTLRSSTNSKPDKYKEIYTQTKYVKVLRKKKRAEISKRKMTHHKEYQQD